MSITTERKKELINQYHQSDNDTGSPEVQIAILTERINNLGKHMSEFKQDFHSRRGLIGLVNRRRTLLTYLKSRDEQRYQAIIGSLGLRR